MRTKSLFIAATALSIVANIGNVSFEVREPYVKVLSSLNQPVKIGVLTSQYGHNKILQVSKTPVSPHTFIHSSQNISFANKRC